MKVKSYDKDEKGNIRIYGSKVKLIIEDNGELKTKMVLCDQKPDGRVIFPLLRNMICVNTKTGEREFLFN